MTKLTKAQLALRTKWTTALRSGEYRQGTGKLRDGDAFCCLGVLCDVFGQGQWSRDPWQQCDSHVADMGDYPGVFLPQKRVSLATGFELDVLEACLPRMNDTDGDDFATIADAIDLDTLMRQDGCL